MRTFGLNETGPNAHKLPGFGLITRATLPVKPPCPILTNHSLILMSKRCLMNSALPVWPSQRQCLIANFPCPFTNVALILKKVWYLIQ